MSASSAPQMRAPLWRGVTELSLACGADAPPGFCAAALAEARRGSPFPVRLADGRGGFGTMALSVALSSETGGHAIILAGARAESLDDAQGALRPRAVRLRPAERTEAALARAFDAVLPWRRDRAPRGPIRPAS